MKRLLLLGVSALLLGMNATAMAGTAESQQQPGYPETYTQSPFSHFIPGQDQTRLAGRIGFSIHIPINGYHGGAISLHSYPGYRHHRGHGYYRYRPHSYYRAYKPHRYRPHRYQPFYYRPHHQRPHHHKPWRFRKHDYYPGQQRHYDGSYYRAERRYRHHEGYRSEGRRSDGRRRDWQ